MTDIVLKDVDPILAERIRRVSQARGWPIHDTIFNLLEQGLFVSKPKCAAASTIVKSTCWPKPSAP